MWPLLLALPIPNNLSLGAETIPSVRSPLIQGHPVLISAGFTGKAEVSPATSSQSTGPGLSRPFPKEQGWPGDGRKMFSIGQNKKISHEALLNHFKENKVEIANAITKPFPFLESLRDRSFITEDIYNKSQEAHRNLIPVEKVAYDVLCCLEKTFDRSLLQVLFSRVHLKEYPALIHVLGIFKNVIEDKYFPQEDDSEETQKLPSTEPSCEQVISSESSEEEEPPETLSSAPGQGPDEKSEGC
ncbi:nuclear body protein SP140-like protein isoform X2 [Canis lupus familiaris]|uniref:nuclear body protein SP140-like protein isoform X2 n=1 Tax=Canis lupus familiaris TaxID=9615 RepID=UPI0018F7D5F6|nr:nuclear body protein SP140-like protein isoform X2 [Canis lupus familiaris]